MSELSGVILDTSSIISFDRRKLNPDIFFAQLARSFPALPLGISSITAVELTHGLVRAEQTSTPARVQQREHFVESVFNGITVHSVNLDIARLAGRLEAEQQLRGVSVQLEDLLIGATALHLGFAVLTLNTRHFSLIPGLQVLTWPA